MRPIRNRARLRASVRIPGLAASSIRWTGICGRHRAHRKSGRFAADLLHRLADLRRAPCRGRSGRPWCPAVRPAGPRSRSPPGSCPISRSGRPAGSGGSGHQRQRADRRDQGIGVGAALAFGRLEYLERRRPAFVFGPLPEPGPGLVDLGDVGRRGSGRPVSSGPPSRHCRGSGGGSRPARSRAHHRRPSEGSAHPVSTLQPSRSRMIETVPSWSVRSVSAPRRHRVPPASSGIGWP